jgi:hypothetical protein
MDGAQKNLAPVRPLLQIGTQNLSGQYLADALKELVNDMLGRHKELFDEVARTTEVTSNFIQGKQTWVKSYWNNQWRIAPVERADPNRVTAINIMQFYCTTQVKMFTASNPDVEPTDEYKQREYRDKVKVAKAVWNHYESKFYTPRFNQMEALHAIVSGNYIESVRYDHLKKGSKVFRELFENKRVRISDGHSRCFSCGTTGGWDDFVEPGAPARCPNCGSMEVTPPEEPVEQEYRSVVGMEPVQIGDLDIRLVPIQTVRFDVRGPIEESSWSIERIEIEEEKLRYYLGDLDIGLADNTTDEGLQSVRAIREAGNTLSGLASDYLPSTLSRMAIVDRICIKPEDVCHIKLGQDTETLSGDVLPKDARLSDFIPPEGATILAVNDGGLIIGLYTGTHHSIEMSSGVYHMRFESGIGRGSEDTVEVQKRFNRNDAQITRYGESTATPARMYVAGAVKRAHVKKIGHPMAAIPVNRQIAEAMGTTELIKTLQPGQIGPQFFQYTYDILNQYRQLTSHSTDFTNAFPGVDNATATGARLAKSNAESVFSPALQLKGMVRIRTAANTLKLRSGQQFEGLKQYFSFGQTENKRQVGRHVSTEEIDPNVSFTVVRDSEQPKTMYDRQIDFVNMMNVAGTAGGYQVLKQTDPKMAEALLKAFDIDLDDQSYTTMVDICETRLDQALELQERFQFFQQVSMMQGMPLPEVPPESVLVGLEPSIATEEPNHMMKAKWFMDYLDSPDGQAMKNEQREIVKMFVRHHAEQEAMQQALMMQLASAAQVMGTQPEREAAAAEQQAAADQEAQADLERSQRDEQAARDSKAIEREDRMAEAQANAQSDAAQSILESGLRLFEAENSPSPTA